ncbi:efflux RND transporter periplasmic adaptor subunit [Paraburkholderia flava]|uniref:efflux RND transporter periplasmic adaptor subunit n=1 Tax=Paraburkholderia flava TaxID=2547393 RepID=UPI00105E9531|nr:efflux RND transporter periplasmic adaptor subunit [Paraburkholderia flava]
MRTSRFSKPARRIAVGVAVLAVAAAVVGWRVVAISNAVAASASSTADNSSVAVQTATIQRGSIAQPVRGYGVVSASASNVTSINLPYVARIVQMRVQPGQTVARGAALFVVQADASAVLAAAQARSALTLAQGELVRTQSLYRSALATQSQLAAAQKAADDARQALAAQQATGIAAGPHTIVAPLDGVVTQIGANQGDQVQAGTTILQLAAANGRNDARANVMLGVEPADAASIHPGDTVTLHGLSTALAGTAVTGHVTLVGAAIDAQSQLVDVGANVPLGQTAFIPGTRISADIATRSGTWWIVPRSAVLKDAQGAYVFQVTPQHKARRVAVVAKVEDGARYGVDGSLDSAQPLVTSGNYELQDGMTVRVDGGAAR